MSEIIMYIEVMFSASFLYCPNLAPKNFIYCNSKLAAWLLILRDRIAQPWFPKKSYGIVNELIRSE